MISKSNPNSLHGAIKEDTLLYLVEGWLLAIVLQFIDIGQLWRRMKYQNDTKVNTSKCKTLMPRCEPGLISIFHTVPLSKVLSIRHLSPTTLTQSLFIVVQYSLNAQGTVIWKYLAPNAYVWVIKKQTMLWQKYFLGNNLPSPILNGSFNKVWHVIWRIIEDIMVKIAPL